jgi:hypothetical protein
MEDTALDRDALTLSCEIQVFEHPVAATGHWQVNPPSAHRRRRTVSRVIHGVVLWLLATCEVSAYRAIGRRLAPPTRRPVTSSGGVPPRVMGRLFGMRGCRLATYQI